MKVCKNNFDICFYDMYYCHNCSFRIGNECKWIHIMRKATLECGGVESNNLSDIFTL